MAEPTPLEDNAEYTVYAAVGCNPTPRCVERGDNGLIIFGADNTVAVLDPNFNGAAKIINTYTGHEARVNTVRWLRSTTAAPETYFISGADDYKAFIWQYQTTGQRNEVRRYEALKHGAPVTDIATLPLNNSNKWLIATAAGETVILWAFNTQNVFMLQLINHRNSCALGLCLFRFPISGRLLLAFGNEKGDVIQWAQDKPLESTSIENEPFCLRPITTPLGDNAEYRFYAAVGCNPTPRCAERGDNGLIIFGADNTVAVLDPNFNGAAKIINTYTGHEARVNTVRWLRSTTAAPETYFISGADDYKAFIWQYQTTGQRNEVRRYEALRHGAPVTDIATLPLNNSNKWLIATAAGETVILWAFNTQNVFMLQLINHRNSCALGLSLFRLPISGRLLLAFRNEKGDVIQWAQDKPLESTSIENEPFCLRPMKSTSLEDDAEYKFYAAVGCNPTLRSAEKGDNGLIVFGADNTVAVVDPNFNGAAKVISTYTGHEARVNTVRWLRSKTVASETYFISGADDYKAFIWQYQTTGQQNEVRRYEALRHGAPVTDIATLPLNYTNKWLIATAAGETVILWAFDTQNVFMLQLINHRNSCTRFLSLFLLPKSGRLMLFFVNEKGDVIQWVQDKPLDATSIEKEPFCLRQMKSKVKKQKKVKAKEVNTKSSEKRNL